jgi:formate/nitrite transporter FocA (FNT family)
MCGLPHCIADAFYYWAAILNGDFAPWMIMAWVWSVVGNYIGCNLPRWFMGDRFET